jgi:hypothetical protein
MKDVAMPSTAQKYWVNFLRLFWEVMSINTARSGDEHPVYTPKKEYRNMIPKSRRSVHSSSFFHFNPGRNF